MYKTFVTCVFFSLLQGCFLDRTTIINEYKSILSEKSANLSSEYTIAYTEYDLVTAQIKNDTWTTIALMNTQIATIKQTINTAKNLSANNSNVLKCIAPQETIAAQLSSVLINQTCWVGISFPDLADGLNALQTLAKIPDSTISACTTLDPLPSQDELFLDCITDKILDLDQELDVLKAAFADVKTAAINDGVKCLADQSALIAQQINQINFQVTLCIALG